MTQQTFSVVGTSTFHNQTKVRWANDLVTRIKMLYKAGHTNIDLYELPQPMTKRAALKWLSEHKNFNSWNLDTQYAVSSKLSEMNKTVKKSLFKVSVNSISESVPA